MHGVVTCIYDRRDDRTCIYDKTRQDRTGQSRAGQDRIGEDMYICDEIYMLMLLQIHMYYATLFCFFP
jgi:hypothetical protein